MQQSFLLLLPTDTFAIELYTTKEMDGGMMIPIPPAVAIRADASPLLYPTEVMAGMMIPPRAATVAGPDPEIAAKKHATSTHTKASPPLICPTNDWANLISFVEIPAFSIIFPAKIKNGIANNRNLLIDA